MIRRLLLLVILSVIATSCYSLDTTLVVNDDGSGSFSLDYLIDKDTSAETLDAGGNLLSACSSLAEIEAAAPVGATVVPLDTGSQCGARLEMTFSNSDELAAGVRQLSEVARFSAFGHFPEVTIQPNGAEGGWKFDAKHKPPVPDNIDTESQFRQDVREGTFTFGVKLPGRQIEHNADRITADGTMIFEIDPIVGGSGQLLVVTEPGATILGGPEPGGLPSIKILSAIAIFALAVAAFGVYQTKKKRQYEGDPDDDTEMIAIGERLGLVPEAADPEDGEAPSLARPESSLVTEESSLAPPESTLVTEESSLAPPESSLPPPAIPSDSPQVTATDAWPSAGHAETAMPVLSTTADAPAPPSEPEVDPGWITAVHSVEPAPAQGETIESPADQQAESADADSEHSLESLEALSPAWPATAAASVSAPWPTGPAPTAVAQPAAQPVGNPAGAWPIGPGAGEPEPGAGEPGQFGEPVNRSTGPAQGAPTQDEMIWDDDRQAYVVFDNRRQAWMVFDQDAQTWTATEPPTSGETPG